MVFLGLVLVITGFLLNAQVLSRARSDGLTAAQTLHSLPWLVALALVAIGFLLVAIGHH